MHADDFMTTTNKNLLMNEVTVLDNFIYMCLAKDVLEFAEMETRNSKTTKKHESQAERATGPIRRPEPEKDGTTTWGNKKQTT